MLCAFLLSCLVWTSAGEDITIGLLMADVAAKSSDSGFLRGRQICGALSYAVEQINDDPRILPGHRLKIIWDDTKGSKLVSTNALTHQWRRGAVAFFGPAEDVCVTEARVASSWNLPMISYVSTVTQRFHSFHMGNHKGDSISFLLNPYSTHSFG